MIVYGRANKTNMEKIDVVARSFLRLLLNAFWSTPVTSLYAELGIELTNYRADWLRAIYTVNLSSKPKNSMYPAAFDLYHKYPIWPTRARRALYLRFTDSITKVIKCSPLSCPFSLWDSVESSPTLNNLTTWDNLAARIQTWCFIESSPRSWHISRSPSKSTRLCHHGIHGWVRFFSQLLR